MNINVLTVNYFSGKFTELLIRSLVVLNPEVNFRIFIYDNGSSDGSLEFIREIDSHFVHLVKGENSYPEGSASHGHALDTLIRFNGIEDADIIMTIDSDCFSLRENWVESAVSRLLLEDFGIIAAPAYCPVVADEHKYMWPGFTVMRPYVLKKIVDLGLSYVPRSLGATPNDSGQLLSQGLAASNISHRYLERTEPLQIGNVKLEKWSIEGYIHHFFAASGGKGFIDQFKFVYGDRSRGRYISKRYSVWKLFRQSQVKDLFSYVGPW